ncbi:MAG: YdeI/OmpD-associated family protein, partial [Janthinobacterium lividum]
MVEPGSPVRFRAVVELGGRTSTGFEVPAGVVARLGPGKRHAVRVDVGGHTYRSTVAVMGGRFMLPLSAENRTAAGVAAGDEVEVEVAADLAPRTVEVPEDLAARLSAVAAAQQTFDGLAPGQRKEWVRWVTEAKRTETRADRVVKTVEAL